MKLGNFEKPSGYSSSEKEQQAEDLDIIIQHERMHRPELDDFADIYPKEKIDSDKRELSRVKTKIHKKESAVPAEERAMKDLLMRRGEALEVIVGDSIEMRNWFGENAMIQRTSEVDDVLHGIDAVVELDREDEDAQRMAMAIDAYSGTSWNILEKKIKRNMERLAGNDESAKIEYFESQIPDKDGNYYKGPLNDLVPIVIGISGENANDLFKKFSRLLRIKDLERKLDPRELEIKRGLENDINSHPVQLLFLEEILVQLNGYNKVIEQDPGKVSPEIQDQVNGLQDIIKSIISEREDELGEVEKIGKDRILEKMKEMLELL